MYSSGKLASMQHTLWRFLKQRSTKRTPLCPRLYFWLRTSTPYASESFQGGAVSEKPAYGRDLGMHYAARVQRPSYYQPHRGTYASTLGRQLLSEEPRTWNPVPYSPRRCRIRQRSLGSSCSLWHSLPCPVGSPGGSVFLQRHTASRSRAAG